MPKPTCDSLVTPLEALSAHDAAHGVEDRLLHDLAVRLMALCELEHVAVGSDLDEGFEAPAPGLLLFESQVSIPQDLLDSGLYTLCLLRKPDEAAVGSGSVIAGHPVGFVPPLESGTIRFPVYAMPWRGDVEERHDGANVWLAAHGSDVLYDCLALGVEQVHKLPIPSRLVRLPLPSREQVQLIEQPSGLNDLPRGRWLLRDAGENCFDRTSTLGIFYDAQTVRPGQYVKPPKARAESIDGAVIIQRLPRGVRCQMHKSGDRAWLFLGDRAVDCLPFLPQAEEIIRDIFYDSVVLDCIMVPNCSPGELHKAVRTGNIRSRVAVEFVAFDCMHLQGEDLHDQPLDDRLTALSFVNGGLGHLRYAEAQERVTPGCLVRPTDSPYPLDWDGSRWMEVPEERTRREEPACNESPQNQERDEVKIADRQVELSRRWLLPADQAEEWLDARLSEGEDGTVLRFTNDAMRPACLAIRQFAIDGNRESATHVESEWSDEGSPARAVLGVQRDDMHEVFLVFDAEPERSGRYVWQWSDEHQRWRCWFPGRQEPYLMSCDWDEERASAESRGGWVAYNVGCLRLLSESPLADLLPMNWESVSEDFEDTPPVDR